MRALLITPTPATAGDDINGGDQKCILHPWSKTGIGMQNEVPGPRVCRPRTGSYSRSAVPPFSYAVWVGHSFPSKEQVSFNFMAAVTVCSHFGVQENKICHSSHFLPLLFAIKWAGRAPRRTDTRSGPSACSQVPSRPICPGKEAKRFKSWCFFWCSSPSPRP